MPDHPLAARVKLRGEALEAAAVRGGEGRRVHVVCDFMHPLRELGHGLTKTPASEVIVQQPAYMRDDRLVEVDISPLLHEPLRAVRRPPDPAAKAGGCQGGCERLLQPIVRRRHHIGRFVVDDGARESWSPRGESGVQDLAESALLFCVARPALSEPRGVLAESGVLARGVRASVLCGQCKVFQ